VAELVDHRLLLTAREKTVEAQAGSTTRVEAEVRGLQEQEQERNQTAVQECKSHILARIIFLVAVAVLLTV
jgi:hypothetical protein